MPPSPPVPARSEDQHPDPVTTSSVPPRATPRNDSAASAASRGSPLSSRQRRIKQPLLIRMNLTETQMDRITDAFTNKVDSSPVRARPRAQVTPTKASAPQEHQSSRSRHQVTYSLSTGGDDESQMDSATFSDLMPRQQQGGLFCASLAERRQQQRPAPIQVQQAQAAGRVPCRAPMEPMAYAVSPLSPTRGGFYSIPGRDQAVSPDRSSGQTEWPSIDRPDSRVLEAGENGPVIDMYRAWAQAGSASEASELQRRMVSSAQRPRRSKSTSEGLGRSERPADPSPPPPVPPRAPARVSAAQALDSPTFSPLALYFRGRDFPTARKGEKTLIGQNGWLERTGVDPDQEKKKAPQKKAGIIESIKKMAKDMTAEFHNSNRRSQPSAKEAATSQVNISLNAREQSLLYCELEYHLTTALNDYITAELDKGHLVTDNLKKVSDWWASQGRPRVVGFRYDLETQLQLVSLHVHDFNFYGRRQSNPVEIAGLLDAMKTNARQMRVRTFCQPDSAVAKQLVDAQSLFNLINVSNLEQAALAEVAQFFNTIVEREKEQRERRIRSVRKTRLPQPGQHDVDVEWPRDERFGNAAASYRTRTQEFDVQDEPLPYAR